MLRKRGVILREIIKDGINEQNKTKSQQGTLVSSEIPSSEDLQHKEKKTSRVNQSAMLIKNQLFCLHRIQVPNERTSPKTTSEICSETS